MFILHSEIAKRTSGLYEQYAKPHVDTQDYKTLHEQSIKQPEVFWDKMAKDHLSFDRPYKTVLHGGFKDGDIQFFPEGSECAVPIHCQSCMMYVRLSDGGKCAPPEMRDIISVKKKLGLFE